MIKKIFTMRKFFIIICLCLFFLQEANGFDGIYSGVSGGGALNWGDQSGTLTTSAIIGGIPLFTLETDLSADLFALNDEVNFYEGFGLTFGCLYAGLEGLLRYSPTNFTEKNRFFISLQDGALLFDQVFENKIKVDPWRFAVDGRIGFKADSFTLLYGRVGVEWARLELENATHVSGLLVDDLTLLFLSTKVRKRIRPLRFGAGIEKMLSPYLSFRADYVYTDYGHLSFEDADSIIQTLHFTSEEFSEIHLKNHALLLGLSYYLCGTPPVCCENRCSNFCGFYAAASVGGCFFNAKIQPNNTISVISETTSVFLIGASRHLTHTAITGNFYAGYGYQCSCFYAALEGFVQYLNAKRKLSEESLLDAIVTGFATKAVLQPWQAGVTFRPGILLSSSTLLYGTIGTSYARIETHIDGFRDVTFATEAKSSRFALRAGIGAEYALCPCWHLRAEYIYTNYCKLKSLANSLQGSTNISIDERVSFETHAVTVGIARYF